MTDEWRWARLMSGNYNAMSRWELSWSSLFVQGNRSQEVQPAGQAHRVSDELGLAGNFRLPTWMPLVLDHTTSALPWSLAVSEQRVVSTHENMNSSRQSMGIRLVCLGPCLEITVKKRFFCHGASDGDNSLIYHVYAPDPGHIFAVYHLIRIQKSYPWVIKKMGYS